MAAPSHNRLAVLAADIRSAHADVSSGALTVAERALAAGRMLMEAKAALPHGAWGAWLAEHAGLNPRTARLYMQLVKSGIETATVAEMGLRGVAVKLALGRAPRPAAGFYAEAVSRGEVSTSIWREGSDRFHVLTMGRIDGQDHSLAATRYPVPDELLSRTVAASGFPLGTVRFKQRELTPSMARVLGMWREAAMDAEGAR